MQSEIILDPFVLLSILDHSMAVDSDRAEGLLLGSIVGNNIEVRNCVPALRVIEADMKTVRAMSPRDMVNGWYSTKVDAERDAVEMTRLAEIISRPLYLAVTLPTPTSQLAFRAFLRVSVAMQASSECKVWKEVPVKIRTSANESMIAIDTFVRTFFPTVATASHPTVVPSTGNRENPYVHLQQINTNLRTTKAYIDAVVSGKLKGDPVLGRELLTLLSRYSQQRRMLGEGKGSVTLTEAKTEDALMLQCIARTVQQAVSRLPVPQPTEAMPPSPTADGDEAVV